MVQHQHMPRFSPNHWSMILMVLLASVIKNILILTPSKRHMSVGSPLCVCVCVCVKGADYSITHQNSFQRGRKHWPAELKDAKANK